MKPSIAELGRVSIAEVDLFSRYVRALVDESSRPYLNSQWHVRNDEIVNFERRKVKMKVRIVQGYKRNKVHFGRYYRFIAYIDRNFMSESNFSRDMAKVNYRRIESEDAFFCLYLDRYYECSLEICLLFSNDHLKLWNCWFWKLEPEKSLACHTTINYKLSFIVYSNLLFIISVPIKMNVCMIKNFEVFHFECDLLFSYVLDLERILFVF